MRVMSMHKSTPSMEAGAPPSQEVIAGMGPLMNDMIQAGVFLGGEGLIPSSHGVRLHFSGGQHTITQGPLQGSNELIDRYLIITTKSMQEAIEWATRFAGTDDAEIDVRPICEPWDLGFMPRPEGAQTRFLIMRKADAQSEAGVRKSSTGELMAEMSRAGVLLSGETLQPSAKGVRLHYKDGQRRVIDGPFAESKELVAGFSLEQVASIDEAIEWADRFAALIGDVEIDIRPLYED